MSSSPDALPAGMHEWNDPLTVCYVIRMYPQSSETFIVNEIRQLERSGVRVEIASCRNPVETVPHRSVQEVEARCFYAPDPLYRHVVGVARAGATQYRMAPKRFRAAARLAVSRTWRHRRPDLLKRFFQAIFVARAAVDGDADHLHAQFAHSATQVAMFASVMTGLPYSFTAHARDIYSDDVDYGLLREQIDRARFAVTVSEFNRSFIEEHTGATVEVIYNGIELDRFTAGPVEGRDPMLVLAVGRLVEKKGLTHLIDAVGRLHRRGVAVDCTIVGDGELREQLQREIEANGLEGIVRLDGLRSQEELPALYRRAGVVVMPAVLAKDGNRDALPTVLLEAMACGAPVIGSRLTGIPEIIDDGVCGLLVDPGDAAGLADAIETIVLDDDLRSRMGAAGRAKAERCFDVTRNVAVLRTRFEHGRLAEGIAS